MSYRCLETEFIEPNSNSTERGDIAVPGNVTAKDGAKCRGNESLEPTEWAHSLVMRRFSGTSQRMRLATNIPSFR